jgi:hypothetical protein
MTIYYCLRFETPPTWRVMSSIYIPQKYGGPVILPGTGFPFHCLLSLVGLRWRYLNPPPHGLYSAAENNYYYFNFVDGLLDINCLSVVLL